MRLTSCSARVQFHVRIAEATQNERLARLVRETLSQFISDRSDYPVGHINIEKALRNQRDTLAAIIDGEREWIARSIDDHLGDAEKYFLGERLATP